MDEESLEPGKGIGTFLGDMPVEQTALKIRAFLVAN